MSSQDSHPDTMTGTRTPDGSNSNFIRDIIDADIASDKHEGRVVTRFPPEPNGYLHIGHSKSICLNFGLALDYKGICHLRFDDTNPTTEDMEYVESIQRDIRWLGFDWHDKLFFASDYYERLYEFAVQLIKMGKAYVCSLSEEDIRKYRGTITEPGIASPYRDRSIEENLDLFRRMRAGEFPDGAHVVRAKIDMTSPNMKMRDPPIYRIRHESHYRTGDTWCIYPLYDFTHCLSDWIEGITHSICTLEFENNRELYDWVLEALELPNRPQQIEFARLNLTSTVMSKRKLLQLVEEQHVAGWDDPRMPTIAGLRRRGCTPEAIRELCERVGIAKNNSTVDIALFEHVLRENLNARSPRVLCVLRPLRVVIDNYPEQTVEQLEAPYFPPDVQKEGSRMLPFSREIYIEQDDFMENPPKDYHRLAPGREVRLRYAYVIHCTDVIKDTQTGEVIELHCSYDPSTRGDGQKHKVKGIIHWVSAPHSQQVEVRLYDRLFLSDYPGSSGADIVSELNPQSLVTLQNARIEPGVMSTKAGDHFQFERQGFFFVDPIDSNEGKPVFNRTVPLKDTWAKLSKAAGKDKGPTIREKEAKPQRTQKNHSTAKTEGKTEPLILNAEEKQLMDKYALPPEDARILGQDALLVSFFEEAVTAYNNAKMIAKWVINDVVRDTKGRSIKDLPFDGKALAELVALIDTGAITNKMAKDIFQVMVKEGGSPKSIVEKQGMQPITDATTLERLVDGVVSENADAVLRYKAGNQGVLGLFVGIVMKKTGGKANPKLLNELLKKKLLE